MNPIVHVFQNIGQKASFHYADDTASGEWRLGRSLELKAMKLFYEYPHLNDEMREVAKGFLWSLPKEDL